MINWCRLKKTIITIVINNKQPMLLCNKHCNLAHLHCLQKNNRGWRLYINLLRNAIYHHFGSSPILLLNALYLFNYFCLQNVPPRFLKENCQC